MEHQVKVKQLTQKFNASDLTCMLKETNFTEIEFIFKDIQKPCSPGRTRQEYI